MYATTKKFQAAAAQPVVQAVPTTNVSSLVTNLIARTQAVNHQVQFQVAQAALERQFTLESAANKAFNVSHNETFTIRRQIPLKGSLRQLAADPSRLVWSGSESPIALPANARLIHLSSIVELIQSDYPVGWLAKTQNMETNSTWTSNGLQGDVHLNANMRNPLVVSLPIYERQNIESFDMDALQGWNTVTEQSLDLEVEDVISDNGAEFAKLAYNGILTQLIGRVLPNLTDADIAYLEIDNKISTFISKSIADKAMNMAKSLLKSTNFCDPNALVVTFARSDGQAVDSMEGVSSIASGLGIFDNIDALDINGSASFTLKQTFTLYYPDA
jgi:hypothetical protein